MIACPPARGKLLRNNVGVRQKKYSATGSGGNWAPLALVDGKLLIRKHENLKRVAVSKHVRWLRFDPANSIDLAGEQA